VSTTRAGLRRDAHDDLALRIGDYVIGTMPGELTVCSRRTCVEVACRRSARDPRRLPAGHTATCCGPKNDRRLRTEHHVWGPLGAEYIAERLLDLAAARADADAEDARPRATRVAVLTVDDGLDQPAPMAGTPATVPPDVGRAPVT
jgi:hypothetical protein